MLTIYRPKTLMDEMFDDFFRGSSFREHYMTSFSPNLNIRETESHVIIDAELPGLTRENVHVNYEDGALTISGERKAEELKEGEKVHVTECRYGSFKRVIPLNGSVINADDISATFSNGILTVQIGKKEEAKPKQIEVKIS